MTTIDSVLSGASAQTITHRRHRRSWVAFAVIAALVWTAAFGLNYAVSALQIKFRKLPVAPRQPLISIAPQLGPWAQVSVDKQLNEDFEHELGTKDYVFRDYVDTRRLGEKDRAKLLAAPLEDRAGMVAQAVGRDPAARVRFAVTYYTGSVDTVPHVPDRCYAADGYRPTSFKVVNWPVLPGNTPTDLRLINFEDPIDSRASRPCQVSYFFQVNGVYEQDPIFGVRDRLQNLFEPHAYFAKIELVTTLAKVEDATPVMTDFLQSAMPEVVRVLPDFEQVKKDAGKEPGDRSQKPGVGK
ncbi:MAG TPA: hypothetical protein VF624_00935 [Tepidisphaeraceae bacterium]